MPPSKAKSAASSKAKAAGSSKATKSKTTKAKAAKEETKATLTEEEIAKALEPFGKKFKKSEMDNYVSLCHSLDKEILVKTLQPFNVKVLNFPFEEIHEDSEYEEYNKITWGILKAYEKQYGDKSFRQKFGNDVSYWINHLR